MRPKPTFLHSFFAALALFTLFFSARSTTSEVKPDPVEANIHAGTHDDIDFMTTPGLVPSTKLLHHHLRATSVKQSLLFEV